MTRLSFITVAPCYSLRRRVISLHNTTIRFILQVFYFAYLQFYFAFAARFRGTASSDPYCGYSSPKVFSESVIFNYSVQFSQKMSASYGMRHIVKTPIGSPTIVNDDSVIIRKEANGFIALSEDKGFEVQEEAEIPARKRRFLQVLSHFSRFDHIVLYCVSRK